MLVNIVRLLFLILRPEILIVISENWAGSSTLAIAEAELLLFVLNLGHVRLGLVFAILGDTPKQFIKLMRNYVY